MNKLKKIALLLGFGYAALLLLDFTYIKIYGQTPAQSLLVVLYSNITSSSRLDGCDASHPCIDNRSQFTRQSSISSYRAFGTGTWSVDMQWADGTPLTWTSFGSTAQVNQAGPSSGIGYGIGPGSIQKSYHDYIRFVITGNATIMNYTGTRQFWWLPSVASIAFPLTLNQGGTGSQYGSPYYNVLGFGATGNGSTDDTTAIQLAITTACTGPGSSPSVFFPHGTYKITSALTFTGQYCSLIGENRGGSIISVTPGSANTDGVTFIHSGTAQFSNGIFHMTITAANTNVRRVVSLAAQIDFTMDDVTINGQLATVGLYMVGMQTSSFHHILVGGPNSGSGDAILIDTSPTSTTVVFDSETDIEGSAGGACLHAKGGSGATSITFSDSTMENCIYGLEAETGVVIHHSHIEFSHTSSYYVPNGSAALIQSDGNNIQQCSGFPSSTIFTLSSGTLMYSANDVTDLASGCTLYAAPTGAKVHTTGPQFPFGNFPEGTLNSGDPNAISAGVLANQSFTATGVTGDFRAQLFRGNFYNVEIDGDTAIHVIGASNHIPAGEIMTFHLTRNSSAVASTSNSLTNDIPIVGQINANGTAANSYQDVVLRMDTSGNFVVSSSPGWSTLSNGSGYPTIGQVGSFTPHLAFSGGSAGLVEQFHSGTYIKIGKQVLVNLFIILSAKGAASGTVSITGLPFTNGSSRSDGGYVYFYSALSGITAMPSVTMPTGGTSLFLYRPSSVSMDDTNFTNTSEINVQIPYQANQ